MQWTVVPRATPGPVVRSFSPKNPIRERKARFHPKGKLPRNRPMGDTTTKWPANARLNYEFLESCKELVISVPHPNKFMQKRKCEFRVSILRWSRGSYIDIRQYYNGKGTGRGILLHIDIWEAILPEVVGVVRRLVMEDTRDDREPITVNQHFS